MKKLLFITVITIFGLGKAHAQDVEFGAKIAINFADIYGDKAENIGPITSILNFGIYSEIPLNEKFSFQPELMYSTQGFAIDKKIIALNYLNLPLMAKYYATKRFSLEAGPQIGFLMSTKGEETNITDNFKTIDFGINLGIGYKLNNGLNFGLRYNLGLSNINNLGDSSDKFRNGVAQISIGYSFF